MAKKMKFKGMGRINNNLRRVERAMQANLVTGMRMVAGDVQRKSMDYTPIDTGNLRAGHRSRVDKRLGRVLGVVYVLAAYALFVHEAKPDTKFKSSWPRGRKFLERAMNDLAKDIRRKLKRWLKL